MTAQNDAIVAAYKAARSISGVSVVYTQGATSLTLRCVPGQTQFSAETADGYVNYSNSDDFLFLVSELTVTPRAGDTIVRSGVTYTVLSMGSDAQYRYSDQEKAIIRIHTRKV